LVSAHICYLEETNRKSEALIPSEKLIHFGSV